MRRKLIKQGNDALTITLPAKWLKSKNLKAGDEIEVDEDEQKLLISGTGEAELKTKTISLEDTSQNHLRSLISSAYKAGYDEIVLKSKQTLKLSQLNEIINTFTGLEIVSQEKNKLVIKSFLKVDENAEPLIIKMFQISKLVTDNLDQDWGKVDFNNLEVLVSSNLRKLRDHCLRTIQINKFAGDKSYDYYDLVTILEKIAAEFLNLARSISASKLSKTDLFTELKELLNQSYSVYLKKDYSEASKYWLTVGKIKERYSKEKNLNKLLKKENASLIAHYYHLINLYRHLSSRLVSLSS
jgi:antitoxin component of MazEF toxin-antitoxin module